MYKRQIITDMAVFTIENQTLTLSEVFAPYCLQDIKDATVASFAIAPDCKSGRKEDEIRP